MLMQGRPLRLAYFVSHPIQYQAPLLRRIAREPDIELEVFFSSDRSVRGYLDEGFGVRVEWDVPLLEGYRSTFLPCWVDEAAEPAVWRPLSRDIFGALERGGFDAVWSHGYSTANSLRAIGSAAMLRLPVLLRAESHLHDRGRGRARLAAKHAFFRALRPRISAVLSIGEANTAYWRHYFGEEMPIFRMPYAVDNAFFERKAAEAAPGREALRRELGLGAAPVSGPVPDVSGPVPGPVPDSEPERRPVVLFASKLTARKRCADLLAAHALLPEPRPWLLVVGDGEERAALERQAAGEPTVRFLGFRNQTELPRFLDLCDVFVLPSQHEPWGLVVNEAMNAGRPVIVSDDVGCAPDLVEDGVTGAVYPVGDTAALARAIARVLARPEVAAQMGARARERVARYGFEQDVAGLREALAFCVPGFAAHGGGPLL
jgi:glycosyltransferase involved in cell wall biosynthesis